MEDEQMDTASVPPFQLSRVINAHKTDAKCVDVTSSNVIISGGRDSLVKFWTKRGGEFSETTSYQQPSIVNSIAYYDNEGDWKLFVGRRDGVIAVYTSGSTEPFRSLSQHTANVSCLHVDKKNGVLLSGSWDNSVIVWSIAELAQSESSLHTLKGHSLSVWALESLEDFPGYYLSGSADKTIKLWHNEENVQSFVGHSDVVRTLKVLNSQYFLSAANDSKIRLWHIESSSCVGIFSSLLDEFIFSISMSGEYLLSCGETGNIEVWKTEEENKIFKLVHKQILRIPAVTAWSSVALSNGDFAVSASDGRIYVYTNCESRYANEELLEVFNKELAERVALELERQEQASRDEIVVKVALDDGAPNMELVYKKNTDPTIAAEKFLQKYSLPVSYLQEITDYIIANIPEARAYEAKKYKKQETQKVEYEGKTYDFGMEITLDSGEKTTLVYNAGDDPDWVAQQFCEKHNLPIKFMAKIAHIIRGDGRAGAVPAAMSEYVDPFTGEGGYRAGEGSSMGSVDFADPFTGGGRYVPTSASGNVDIGGDPLTSGGRYIPGSGTGSSVPNSCLPHDKKRPRGELVPLTAFFSFGMEQLSQKAIVKLRETNEKQDQYQLNENQMAALEELIASQPGTLEASDALITGLDTALLWSIEDVAPVCDLFRMALLHENLNSTFCNIKGRGATVIERLSSILISDPPDSTRIFICRAIVNAFLHPKGQDMVQREMTNLVSIISSQLVSNKGPLQIAATSALANWAYLMLKQSETISELGPREDVLRNIVKVLETFSSFGDYSQPALVRLLQAIVTLMWGDSQVISLAKSRNIVSIVNKIKDAVVDERGKNIARDIVEMTYAV